MTKQHLLASLFALGLTATSTAAAQSSAQSSGQSSAQSSELRPGPISSVLIDLVNGWSKDLRNADLSKFPEEVQTWVKKQPSSTEELQGTQIENLRKIRGKTCEWEFSYTLRLTQKGSSVEWEESGKTRIPARC